MQPSAKVTQNQWAEGSGHGGQSRGTIFGDRHVMTTISPFCHPRSTMLGGYPLRYFFLMAVLICFVSLRISPLMVINDSYTRDAMITQPTNNGRTQDNNPAIAIPLQTQLLFNTSNIPKFMMEYFEWHAGQLQKVEKGELFWIPPSAAHNNSTSETPKQLRYLIMRCIDGDRCGGTSDRLKAFPLFLLLAKQSNRILLIRWGQHRPFPISEFLKPGPLWNWTVPRPVLRLLEESEEQDNGPGNVTTSNIAKLERSHHMHQAINGSDHRRVYYDGTKFHQLRQSIMDPDIWVVEGNDYSGGARWFHDIVKQEISQHPQISGWKLEDSDYANFYHDLFHASFQPSNAVEALLRSYIDINTHNGLAPTVESLPVRLKLNNYMVAHYRAKYPGEPYRETWNTSTLEQTARHAVECAMHRSPSLGTVYFASDTALATQMVYSEFTLHGQQRNEQRDTSHYVWSYLNLEEQGKGKDGEASQRGDDNATIPFAIDPPHLNFAKLEEPSGFYGIFVDLFLMSYSTCVVYGAGGFGRFGSLVSFNPKCGMPFTKQKGVLQECQPYRNVEI
ncbi:hypothetical protein IV203_026514 [Nitzschia inconspicua]|uniref:Uncharacterized protein n=1 Tax=Nitzschia inconspicua TaxID=303405 RepID=A0A9K3LIR3_9STRA|nr:hypothetical protein IV203_026514 [Nitzschia inconspicua]